MMIRVSDVVRGWLGWCPNAPPMRTAPTVLMTDIATVHPLEEGGGAGGAGRIDRGITFAMESTKTLIRNKQLLWFSVLAGLVMLFTVAETFGLYVFGTDPYSANPYPAAFAYPVFLLLVFGILAISIFLMYYLLAGLVLSVSPSLSGKTVSLREGLAGAKTHVRALLVWSAFTALLGTAAYSILTGFFGVNSFLMYDALNQFPFGFIFLPELWSIGPIGGTYHILSTISFVVTIATIAISLFILTLFVVPVLVLENKRLPDAVAESIALVKRSWVELITCFVIFGVVLLMFSLASMLFGVVYGIISPDMLIHWRPGMGWIAGAVGYVLAGCILAFVCSTIAGIATLELYSYAKTGRVPAPEERPGVRGSE